MRIRNRMLARQIAVLLITQALCFIAAFFVFLLTASPLVGERRLIQNIGSIAARYFPAAAAAGLVIGAAGVLVLSMAALRRVYAPLGRLKTAALHIRNGNLGYELPAAGQGDFAELSAAFEDMRVHLKNSTQAAERAERERRAMMANITHDLRTPITSILGYSEGILDGVAQSPEQVLRYAGIIRGKAQGLRKLAEDLALLGLLEDEPPLELERLDAAAWFRARAEEAALELDAAVEWEITDEALWCAADREKLARVVGNLLSNAVKYGRRDGVPPVIRFEARRDGEEALLTVADNGPGLPLGETRRAFERFYRADRSRGVVAGSGLGLSIARQIAELHKGKVWLANLRGGEGLSANVSLPLLERRPPCES
ncbi:MAG: HAMP domain-containing histidine kinase [Oscillospiraceae bacterium]|nr:HAMP domain-containing histidine kinase [Oscillospiraceae bacterium]